MENDLDTSGPFRDVLLAFAATVAQMERAWLIGRTNAGLARARAQGRVGGRPRKEQSLIETALKFLDDGASYGRPFTVVRSAVLSWGQRSVRGEIR